MGWWHGTNLTGIPFAQILDCRRLLLLADLFVLLLVGGSLKSLPGKAPAQEVHENVTQRLEIISSRLFAPQVRIDTHVACCAGQRFALAVGDVLLGLGVSVLLGHAEIDDVDHIGRFGAGAADQEIVGLDVSVDEVLFVNRLDAGELSRCQGHETRHIAGPQPGDLTICLATITTVLVENRRLQ